MSKYYLRVEAVNLSNFVYDTHDISTIRGGSYLLLDAIESMADQFKGRLEPITLAASQGLFWFETSSSDPDIDCRQIEQDVLAYLAAKTGGHSTFLAATQVDIPKNFPQVLEKLEAQIHWQQWHMPTVTIPNRETTDKECYLDGWRPGVIDYNVDPSVGDARISTATYYRRQEGRKIKHRLFFEILGDEQYLGQISVKDLGELSQDSTKGILNGKIAYIHVDGNSFGSIRRKLCNSEEDRKGFDDTIQTGFRIPFLKALLEWAKSDPDFQTYDMQGKIALRLEVLLWGGDEMTLVVPAWMGLRVAQLFFEHTENLQFKDLSLSHRAAVIFCHHNAPILLVRQLAEQMLDRTKTDIKATLQDTPEFQSCNQQEQEKLISLVSSHTYGDALHYLVLESFDLLQGELDDFLGSYYKGIDYKKLLITAVELGTIFDALKIIRSNIPRGKALKIIDAVQEQKFGEVDSLTKEVIKLIPLEEQTLVARAIEILTQAGQDHARWYLATDLWDYIPE